MSYARFGSQGSDVYVYAGSRGFVCCWCWLNKPPKTNPESVFGADTLCDTEQEMIDHLRKHREAGHTVPNRAIERLESEREEGP